MKAKEGTARAAAALPYAAAVGIYVYRSQVSIPIFFCTPIGNLCTRDGIYFPGLTQLGWLWIPAALLGVMSGMLLLTQTREPSRWMRFAAVCVLTVTNAAFIPLWMYPIGLVPIAATYLVPILALCAAVIAAVKRREILSPRHWRWLPAASVVGWMLLVLACLDLLGVELVGGS